MALPTQTENNNNQQETHTCQGCNISLTRQQIEALDLERDGDDIGGDICFNCFTIYNEVWRDRVREPTEQEREGILSGIICYDCLFVMDEDYLGEWLWNDNDEENDVSLRIVDGRQRRSCRDCWSAYNEVIIERTRPPTDDEREEGILYKLVCFECGAVLEPADYANDAVENDGRGEICCRRCWTNYLNSTETETEDIEGVEESKSGAE